MHSRTAAALKLLMAISVLFSCPLKLFPSFEIVEAALSVEAAREGDAAVAQEADDAEAEGVLLPQPEVGRSSPTHRATRLRNGLRAAHVLVAASLALGCPDFEFLVAFIGAFCMGLIAFVLPPLMYCALLPPGRPLALVCHALLFLLGTAVLVGGTFTVLREKLLQ